MPAWRVYRLPGDKQWWQVDGVNDKNELEHADVLAVRFTGNVWSVDMPNTNQMPRAWFETDSEPETLHYHLCACGQAWLHWSNRGNVAAHTCSKCGELVWMQADRKRLAGASSQEASANGIGFGGWALALVLFAAAVIGLIWMMKASANETT